MTGGLAITSLGGRPCLFICSSVQSQLAISAAPYVASGANWGSSHLAHFTPCWHADLCPNHTLELKVHISKSGTSDMLLTLACDQITSSMPFLNKYALKVGGLISVLAFIENPLFSRLLTCPLLALVTVG